MSEDAFEYVWRIIKADEDEMMRRLEEGMLSDQTHPNECEECGQPGELSNYPDDSICDDCMSAHADVVDPLPAEAPSKAPSGGGIPIEYGDACPHCGAKGDAPIGYEYNEHEMIDHGMERDYYQTYQCFECSGHWSNLFSFSKVVLE